MSNNSTVYDSLHFVAVYDFPNNITPVVGKDVVKVFYAMDNALNAYKVTIRETEKFSIAGFAERNTYDIDVQEIPVSEIYCQHLVFHSIMMDIDDFSIYKMRFFDKYQGIIDKDLKFIDDEHFKRPMYGIFHATQKGIPFKGEYVNNYGDFVKDISDLYEIPLRGNTWKKYEFAAHHEEIPFIFNPAIAIEMARNVASAYGIDRSELKIVLIKEIEEDLREYVIGTAED